MVVVFILLGVVCGEILIFKYLLGNPSISPLFRELYSFTVTVSCVMFFLWLWLRYIEQRAFRTIGLFPKSILRHYSLGFLTGMVMMLCIVGFIALTGNVHVQNRRVNISVIRIFSSSFVMLFAYIIQGANEEIISRGWQFQVIGRKYSPWLGALVSSILFALLHISASGANLIAFLNLLLFSLLLVLFVLKHQSIWAACGWHSAWNWMMGSVLGLKVSGRNEVGTLFDLRITGSKLISGGKYGPEGSIVATVVLLFGVLMLLFVGSGISTKSSQ